MLGKLLARRHEPAALVERSWSLGQLGVLAGYMEAVGSRTITFDRALTHAATSACVDRLASSVSSLPVDAVLSIRNVRLPVFPAPPLTVAPSALVDLDVWLYQVVEAMLTDGNAFGLAAAMVRGLPTQIELVDSSTVTRRAVRGGVAQADVDGVTHQVFPHGDLVHIPGKLVRAGSPFAASPVQRAAETIAAALAARRFGSDFFDSGGHPTTVIKSSEELTQLQAEVIKKAWLKATSGREPAVLGAGLDDKQIQVDPNDSQFLDLMRFAIEEACRFFGVPPSMVFAATSGQNVTYANVSSADLHFLKHSLDVYLVRIERKLSLFLPAGQEVKFQRNALLRADAETRGNVYDKRLRNRTMTVNEVRALEDEEPFGAPEFDEPGIPGESRDLSIVEAVQKVYLGVGSVLTADEAREIINAMGGDLAVPGPLMTPSDPPKRMVREVERDDFGQILRVVEDVR